MRRSLAVFALIALAATAQDKSPIKTSGEEVLVDVVVRDKNGRTVENLPASAFTVSDEGEPRQITAFRLVKGAEVIQEGGSVPEKLDPLHQIRLITLVFDRLDQTARLQARAAALDLLKNDLPPNVYVSVFTLADQLQGICGFTNKRDLLARGIERATSGPATQFANDSEQLRQDAEQRLGPNQTGAQDLLTRYQQMNTGGDPFVPAFARITIDMISLSERSELAYSGRSTIWALLAAVRGQSQLPGRKAVVYFSPGFSIPQGAEEEFQAVISEANRNNLSFYPIDAHGLSTIILNAKSTEALSNSARAASMSNTLGLDSPAGPLREIALSTDSAINANRLNTLDTLAMLAGQTGGFLTANTNDFNSPLRRVLEEINSYYEIGYTPRIENYDGRFRHIGVKLDRSDLRVQAKAGYFALPPNLLRASGLNWYEAPLLRALSELVPNNSLPFESGALHFHGEGRLETCGFLIDMPLSALTLATKTGNSGVMTGGLAYVALIKDVKGAVVKTLQGEMPVELTAGQLLPFKEGRFTDMEYFDVTPGYYTVEVAVLDRETGKTGARRNAFFVPRQGDGLAISSVSLIRKWRPKEAEAPADDPFVVGDKTVTPTLVPRINKSVSSSLPFYLIIYPNAGNSAKPEMLIEFTRDGDVKRVAAPVLGAPDAEGRIQYIANAPIGQFTPGNYAVRFVVKQGAEIAQESFAIDLQP